MKSKILLILVLCIYSFGSANFENALSSKGIDQSSLDSIESQINSSASVSMPDGSKVAIETDKFSFISEDNEEPTSCNIECPTVKEGFFTRKANFIHEKGVIECFVYTDDAPTTQVAVVSQKNKYCIEAITPNIEVPNIDQYNYSSSMDTIKNKYDNYINTGNEEFLNLPKYMIAGLTVDNEKVDVSTSIINNEVTLRSGYTVYPNANSSSTSNSFLDQVYNINLVSSIKLALDNSVVFIMNFLDRANVTFVSLKVTLFFMLVPLSVILASQSKITKYMSSVTDHEDIAEKVLMGFVSFFLFYITTTQVPTDSDRYISQNVFQNTTRPFFYKVSEKADDLATSATIALLSYKYKQVGMNTKEDIQNIQEQIVVKSTKQLENLNFIKECSDTYNTANLRIWGEQIGVNQTYPPTETIKSINQATGNEEVINFYTTGSSGFLNDSSYLKQSNIPSVSFCYKMQRDYMQNKIALESLYNKYNLYSQAMGNEVLNKQVTTLTDLVFRSNAELGWVGISTLATTTLAFDKLGVINVPDNKAEKEKALKDFRDSSGYEVGGLVSGDGAIKSMLNKLISSFPYMMLPGADTMQKLSKDFMDSVGNPVTESLNKIPVIGGFLSAFAGGILSTLTLASSVFLTAYLMAQFLSMLPIVAIIAASFMAIGFYYLSVELFYMAIPFVAVFAFSTGNLDILKHVFKNFFILALKPILIVISVITAIFIIGFFDSFHQMLVNSMFEPINMLLAYSSDNETLLSSFMDLGTSTYMIFFKGLIHIASSVIALFTAFYLVFNGANMILDMFGLREVGLDVGNAIGDKVENNSTAKKMNVGI